MAIQVEMSHSMIMFIKLHSVKLVWEINFTVIETTFQILHRM